MPTPRVARQRGTGRNGQRSRKGCPECRSRRIKCDETQPECGQCVKGGRACRIIDGLFRPHHITMPMPTESASRAERSPNPQSPGPQTLPEEAPISSVPEANADDVNPAADGPRTPISPHTSISLASPTRSRGSIPICGLLAQSSLPETIPEILETPSAQSLPPVDHHVHPSPTVLQNTPTSNREPSAVISAIPQSIPEESNQDRAEIGFFLRLFADGGAQWMDICTGQRSYFSHYVVQLASQSPLVRYSACALAAKQVGQMRDPAQATTTTPRSHMMTSTLLRPNMDFLWYGAKYYEKAILLMAHQISHNTSTIQNHLSPGEIYQSPDAGNNYLDGHESTSSAFRILAACILCSYEDLSATMRAWTGHLDGINKLLRPHLDLPSSPVNFYCIPQPIRALEVSFWYFALNDMLNSRRSSFYARYDRTNLFALVTLRQPCRIDTEDIPLWQRMGLPLDGSGHLAHDIEGVNQESTFFKALIRLLCKIASQSFKDATQWAHIDMEFTEWYNALPSEYLAPVSQTLPPTQNDTKYFLPETWFGSETCAIAMAFYHMARILLLVNQPQEAFLAMQPHKNDLLGSYNALQRNLSHHAMEIIPIAHGMPGSITVQKYMVQPLYIAGRCLSSWNERQIVVEHLRHIETTLGLATEYSVRGLAEEWGISYESLVSNHAASGGVL